MLQYLLGGERGEGLPDRDAGRQGGLAAQPLVAVLPADEDDGQGRVLAEVADVLIDGGSESLRLVDDEGAGGSAAPRGRAFR